MNNEKEEATKRAKRHVAKLYLNRLYGSVATGKVNGFTKIAVQADHVAIIPGFIYADTDTIYREEES